MQARVRLSARRATPIGNNCEATAAPTTAIRAPPSAMGTVWKPPAAMIWRRVRPSAPCVVCSTVVAEISRLEHDRDGHESREGGDASEYPQRDGEHVDRVLRALGVNGEILNVELRRSENPTCGRGDLRDILGSVASVDPQDRAAEAPYRRLELAVERRSEYQHAAGRAPITQVERPPDDADDPEPNMWSLWVLYGAGVAGAEAGDLLRRV